MVAVVETPWLMLFPYLPVSGELEIGRWKLVPVQRFEGPWHSPAFRRRSLAIIHRHVDRSGRPLEDPSILVDREAGADGVLPAREEIEALQLALGFGVIDAVPTWHSDAEMDAIAAHEARRRGKDEATIRYRLVEDNDNAQYSTWRVGTADNAEPFFWPVHPTGRIARQYGTIMSTTVAGSGRGLAGKVIPPNELHLPRSISLDAERVAALYTVLAKAPGDHNALKLRESIRWLLQAWRNTPSLLEAQRVVLLRTAYEVLLGDPGANLSKEKLARHLSGRFKRLQPDELRFVSPGDMLWQPSAPRNLQLPNVSKALAPYSELERWFIGLSTARNKIVHEGNLSALEDTTAVSVYAGPYWRVATRVLREVILVDLCTWGFTGLWDDYFGRATREVLKRSAAAE
jgi:hypothetical protein